MIPQIYLRKGKEESLLRRHPWIFSGAIDHIKAEEESDFAEGALVEVYTRQGVFIVLTIFSKDVSDSFLHCVHYRCTFCNVVVFHRRHIRQCCDYPCHAPLCTNFCGG